MTDPAKPPPSQTPASPHPWTAGARFAFRFVFIYWILFFLDQGVLDLLLWMLPGLSHPVAWITRPLHLAAQWTGVHLFGLTGIAATEHPTTAGDTALQYVLCFCFLVVAFTGAAVWTAVSERRGVPREYRTMYAWLRLGLRFALGVTLLVYGFDKVFNNQFPPPGLLYLTETVGDSSPMRLLWAFMGASVPYNFFAGLAEVTPGFLLLFWRTSTLGALLASGVLLNVVLLNYCYDVSVKLYSTHLLLAAVFLVLPDAASLVRIFLLGRAAALTGLHLPSWERRPLRLASRALQILVLGGMIYQTGWDSYHRWRDRPTGRSPLYGVWTVDRPADRALPEPWATVIFDGPGDMIVLHADGSKTVFAARFSPPAQQIELPETDKPSSFHWTRDGDGTLLLAGTWSGKPITLTLHPKPVPETFPLQSRGFHWVQEYSYNR